MATTPKKRPPSKADQVYESILANLQLTMTAADKAQAETIEQANELVHALVGFEGASEAQSKLRNLENQLKVLSSRQTLALKASSKEAERAINLLTAEMRSRRAAEKSREAKERVRLEYQDKILKAQAEAERKSRKVVEDYLKASSAIQESSLAEMRELRSTVLKGQIDNVNRKLKELDRADKMLAESRPDAEKGKPKKSERQELLDELRELRKGFFRRNVVDRMVVNPASGALSNAKEAIKDRTGISAIQRALAASKERKNRRGEVEHRLKELAIEESRTALERSVRQMEQASDDVGRMGSGPIAALIQSSMNAVTAAQIKTANILSELEEESSKKSPYTEARKRSVEERQLRALESLAKGRNGRKGLGIGWADLAGLAGMLSGAISGVLGKFSLKNPLASIGAGLEWLKAASTKTITFVSNLFSNLFKVLFSAFPKLAPVGAGAAAAASTAAKAASGGSKIATAAKAAGSSIGRVAQSMAASPAAQAAGRVLNKVANIGAAISVVTGVAEEANGRKVDSLSVMDAIMDPMKSGRYLGNKFNQTFERKMGMPFGAWVYDLMNGDPNASEELKRQRGMASTAGQGGRPVSTVQQRDRVAAATPPSPTNATKGPNGMPAPIQTQQTVSQSPNLSVSGIPDYAGFDPFLHALNIRAL